MNTADEESAGTGSIMNVDSNAFVDPDCGCMKTSD
jgi:hypothetical protein